MANEQVTPAYKTAHLEMLQGVINRMAGNSFKLKNWSVVLVSALFALAGNQKSPFFAAVAFLPALVFWGLDGYFLHQERLFRELYDKIRAKKEEEIDFDMSTHVVKDQVAPLHKVIISPTLAVFHGAVLAAVVVVLVYLVATCDSQTAKAISSLSTMARHFGGFC